MILQSPITLTQAIGIHDTSTVRRLLAHGASLEHVTDHDHPPLHQAAPMGQPDIVSILLDAGADPNSRTPNGFAPLHRVAGDWWIVTTAMIEREPEECVGWQEFQERGARMHAQARILAEQVKEAMTPSNGHGAVMRYLIAAGALVDARSRSGYTPLHRAANTGATVLMRQLIEAGADINSRTIQNQTPLGCALQNDDTLDGIRLLLEFGADPSWVLNALGLPKAVSRARALGLVS